MVSLGTQPVIERAGLVTPRLPVRALKIYPDNRMHGSTGGRRVKLALPRSYRGNSANVVGDSVGQRTMESAPVLGDGMAVLFFTRA